jgi:isoleucyl-tRNA synthetase
MIWNVYDFFTTYAEIDGVDSEELCRIRLGVSEHFASPSEIQGDKSSRVPDSTGRRPDLATRISPGAQQTAHEHEPNSVNPLDTWIISRIYQLRNDITTGMEEYNIPKALEGVLPFIDDLSNWFVRRSRRRFSKNDDADDKNSAYATLYFVLVYLSKILAPFTPFLAEELYQKMTGKNDSVHLLDWPEAGDIDTEILDQMSRTRQIITDALALRMRKSDSEEQIKVRQPLASLTYDGDKLDDFYEDIIAEEVNVKSVKNGKGFALDKTLTDELKREGYARDLVRAIQSARKHAGLKMDDRIKLSLSVDLPKGYEEMIKTEAKADDITKDGNFAHDEIAKINGDNVTISLEKA